MHLRCPDSQEPALLAESFKVSRALTLVSKSLPSSDQALKDLSMCRSFCSDLFH